MMTLTSGAALVLYFQTVHVILQKPKLSARRNDIFLLSWSTIIAVLIAFCNASNAIWGEIMWITDRDNPGGVPEFIATQQTVWYQDLGTTSSVVMLLMNDALMVRFF